MSSKRTYFLAPLAGYSDLPFRRCCRRFGLVYAHTPLLDAGALLHHHSENQEILARGDDEPWLAVQLMGCRLDDLRQAAGILNELPFDGLDFNMGCPVRKVMQRHAGAALLKTRELALDCVRALRDVVKKPLTVKTRILCENDPEPTVRFCLALQACGIDGLTLHGRLPQRIYAGPVAMDVIKAVREALRIPVTANGGIFTAADADALAAGSGCERLMVARGAIGNPWLFRELIQGIPAVPTHAELCDMLLQQVTGMVELYGETRAFQAGRKIILSYLCGRGYRRRLRAQMSTVKTMPEFLELFRQIEKEGPLAVTDGLGVVHDGADCGSDAEVSADIAGGAEPQML
ncbi:MAG: tRNA dihydrouridine synthase [Lentisphaeria bacterium]|jgi:tRNA-dihydrouridine synthase B